MKSKTLSCSARLRLQAQTARRARRMRLETPASPPAPSQRRAKLADRGCSSDSEVVEPRWSSRAHNKVSRNSAKVPDGHSHEWL